MKEEAKPIRDRQEALKNILDDARTAKNAVDLDFSNTEIAFSNKTDKELKRAYWLFRLMNHPWLVKLSSTMGMLAVKWRLPFAERIVRGTIFEQFCGGTTLLESQDTINRLYRHQTLTILDYGAEAKSSEDDFNITMNETIRALEFAATNASVPVVSTKISGFARFGLLEKFQSDTPLSEAEKEEHERVLKRIDSICYVASQKGVSVFFDAEESWIQDSIDFLVNKMMARYNKNRVVVYNTFQMYRKDRLQFLMDSFNAAQEGNYLLGAKLVRGAYMDKERDRAARMEYPSPIHDSKEATDDSFDTGIRLCVDNYEKIASCNASHNAQSAKLQAELIHERGLPKNHPHLNFCQLMGMSDNLTFNLAEAGYNVAKYVPYGPVREVLPYLVRRAEENSSVTGDMSRELKYITQELRRRGLQS